MLPLTQKNESTGSTTFMEKLYNAFPVEDSQRSKICTLRTIINYSLDYVLIFVLVVQASIGFTPILDYFYLNLAFISCRAGMAVLFILTKHLSFIIGQKLLLLASLIMFSHNTILGYHMIAMLFEIAAAAAWAFTRQQRQTHYDSRLNLLPPFCKQVALNLSIFTSLAFPSTANSNYLHLPQQCFLMFLTTIIFLSIDDYDLLYFIKTKLTFLLSDLWLLVCLLTFIWFDILDLQLSISLIVIYPLIIFLALMTYVYNYSDNFYESQSDNLQQLKQRSVWQTMRYYQQIMAIIQHRMDDKLVAFVQKYILQSDNVKIVGEFIDSGNDITLKYQTIQQMLFKELSQLAKRNEQIRKFLIFYLSPSDKVYRILDTSTWYHNREYLRIVQSAEQIDNAVKIFEAEKERKIIIKLIKAYIMHGNQFYRGLLHEKVTKFAVIHEGEAMIDLLAQIEKKKGDNHRFTQDVRNLLNSFSLKVVNRTCKVLDNMIDPPYLLQKTSENPPCVLISAEQDLFAQVLDANLSFEKGTYFSKKMLKGVSLSILVPTEIRQAHTQLLTERSKKKNFSGLVDFPREVFVPNRLGYLILARAQVYPLNQIQGRSWCVILYPAYATRSIFVVTEINRNYKGSTDLCRYHGITPSTLSNCTLKKTVYDELLSKQVYAVDTTDSIFQGSTFLFSQPKVLRHEKTVNYPGENKFNFTYHFFQVLQREDYIRQTKKFSGLLSSTSMSVVSDHNRVRNLSDKARKFQFHFHWSGKIANYKQQQPGYTKRIIVMEESSARVNGDYGQNIAEMRLFKQAIDFVQNADVETVFMPCPQPAPEEVLRVPITKELYESLLQKKRKSVPFWLKSMRGVLIVLFVAFITIAGLVYQQNQVLLVTCRKQLNLISLLQQNYFSIVQLCELGVLSPYLYGNASQPVPGYVINHVLQDINTLSNNISSLSTNIFTSDVGMEVQKFITNILIMANDMVSNSLHDNRKMITYFYQEVNDKFEQLIATQVDNVTASLGSNGKYLYFTQVILLLLGFSTWLYMIRVNNNLRLAEQEVIRIWIHIDSTAIERERQKVNGFELQHIYNQEVQDEEIATKQQEELFKKKISSIQQRQTTTYLFALWVLLAAAVLFLAMYQYFSCTASATRYVNYIDKTSQQIRQINIVWLTYNLYPVNKTLQLMHLNNSIVIETQRIAAVRQMFIKSDFSPAYGEFYGQFWSGKCCPYFQQTLKIFTSPPCSQQLFTALQQGVNQLTSYLQRQYDDILINTFTDTSIYSIPSSLFMARIVYNYLLAVPTIENTQLMKQFSKLADTSSNNVVFILVGEIVIGLALFVFCWMFQMKKNNLLAIESTLQLIPFQELTRVAEFRKYFREKCYDGNIR